MHLLVVFLIINYLKNAVGVFREVRAFICYVICLLQGVK
jgi:hypothetical protein